MSLHALLQSHPSTTFWGHVTAVASWFGAVLGVLPVLAALFGVVWYGIQIYESDTIQKYLEKRRMERKARRIAKLRAEQKVLLAELEALEVVREARTVAAAKVASAAHEARVLEEQHKVHEKKQALEEAPGRGAFTSIPAQEPPRSGSTGAG
jgi:hypothetical protein